MTNGELKAKLALWPDDAEIVTHGDDGEACTDVHVEPLDDPWRRLVSKDKSVIFIRGYGPGDVV